MHVASWPCFQQAIETSALAEQEAELPLDSATDNVEVAPTTEAEAPLETDNGAEVEALQKVDETETALKEKAVLAEEAIAVNVEAPQEDGEAKKLPTEPDSVAPEAESEELQIQEAEEAQSELKHTEPLEVVEVIQEVIADEVSLYRIHTRAK